MRFKVGLFAGALACASLLAPSVAAAQSAPTSGNGTIVSKVTTPLIDQRPIFNSCAQQDGGITLSGTQIVTTRQMPDGTMQGDLRDMLTGTSATGVPYIEIIRETSPVPITLVNFSRTELLISQGPSANQRTVNVGQGNVVTCFGDDSATI